MKEKEDRQPSSLFKSRLGRTSILRSCVLLLDDDDDDDDDDGHASQNSYHHKRN
jgi:hypothetical protein